MVADERPLLFIHLFGGWLAPLAARLRDLGQKTVEIKLEDFSDLHALETFIADVNPRACFLHNYYLLDSAQEFATHLEAFLVQKKIIRISWFIDDPFVSGSTYHRLRLIRHEIPKENLFFFCADRYHARLFQQLGYDAEFLPLGIDENYKDLPDTIKSSWSRPVPKIAFAATPPFKTKEPPLLDLNAYRDASLFCFEKEFQELVEALTKVGGPTFSRELIQKGCHFFKDFFLKDITTYQAYMTEQNLVWSRIDTEISNKLFQPRPFFQARVGFLYSLFQMGRRTQILCESLGMSVYGGEGWKGLVKKGAEYSDFLSMNELLSLFHHAPINFCYTKWQFPSSMTERPLLIWAAGGFPLVDDRADFREFFRPDEVAIYTSFEEAHSLIGHYLKNDSERIAMIEKARKRLFAEHTLRHRVEQVLKRLATL